MNWARLQCLIGSLCLAVVLPAPAGASEWNVLAWPEPYDYSGIPSTVMVEPLARAARPWRICASYPHLKDAYWISVNYGMVEQALAAGVQLTVIDAAWIPKRRSSEGTNRNVQSNLRRRDRESVIVRRTHAAHSRHRKADACHRRGQ